MSSGTGNLFVVLVIFLVTFQAVLVVATDYIHDGKTTYCWQVDASVYANSIDDSVSVLSSSGDGCALSMSIGIPSNEIYVNDAVEVTWNATLRLDSNGTFESNKFNIVQLYLALDRVSQKMCQVMHSRLHTCVYGEQCDPVLNANQLYDNSSKTVTNFTEGAAAFSSNELTFSEAGNYTLLAHLILPSSSPTTRRYDYAVYTLVQVLEEPSDTTAAPYSTTTTASSDNGMSTETLCVIIISGMVAVALIGIGFTSLRTKDQDNPLSGTATAKKPIGYRSNPVYANSPAIAGDNLYENDFAMLSVHEATMNSERGRTNTFLTAIARTNQPESAKAANPVAYVGPLCSQSFQRDPIALQLNESQSRTKPNGTEVLETPSSARENRGDYADMNPTPKRSANIPENSRIVDRQKSSARPAFNNIPEDAIDEESDEMQNKLGLTELGHRIRGAMLNDSSVWQQKKGGKMTADDLRSSVISVKSEVGQKLSISDLGGGFRDSDFD